jgi:hypothetical protein
MIVNVKLENFHNLECFRNILEKYRDYKSFYRELKINSLLGNKSQFDIDDIDPPIICGFEEDQLSFGTFRLKDSAFSVESMSFIVDKDLNVIKIDLNINMLETINGKTLLNLLKIGHLIDFRIVTSHYMDHYEIVGFQACSKSKLAA